MAVPKRAHAVSAISFILASLLVLSAAPANAAETPAPSPGPVDPAAIPAARFAVAEAATLAATSFTDVTPLTPLYNEINWMGTSGVVTFGGNFGPAAGTTKGQMAVWAYKVAGSPAYTAPAVSPFKDLPATAAGYKEVAWANSKGILVAGADKLFQPAAVLRRMDAAAALYRLAGAPAFTPPTTPPFRDFLKTAAGYKEITWAAALGLVGGYSDGTYKPYDPARHDTVAVAYNKFVTRPQAVTTTAASLSVGPFGTGHASALVRLSVVNAPADATLSVGGAPVLTVKAKTSGSTTVLVPLTAGTISVTSSAATSVSVDVLATFDGTATTPGSTIAIAPVTRADTVMKLAADTLSPTAFPIGLTGSGGVPSTGVRAVYATATVTVPAARTLTLGDQKIAVPAGTSSTTTILVPKVDGTANASIDSGSGSLRLDVRGYVPESSQNANSVNVSGSFVPAVKPMPQTVQVYGPGKASVTISGVKDRSFALAMVSTTPSASPLTAPGYLTLGSKPLAGLGALVDPATGGQSQLVIVPAGTAATPLSVSAGTTKATITPVGDILSPTAGSTDAAPTVKITSPVNGSTVDLSKTGLVRLEGDITGGSLSTAKVTVSVAGAVIGSAIVRQTATGASWSFETGIPKSGDTRFDVLVTDRSGRTGSTSVTVKATLPASTVTLVAPESVVLDPAKPELTPTAVSASAVTFSKAPTNVYPGKVIVSGKTAVAPEGVLRKVTAVNKTAAGWVVDTAPATITDAVKRADIDKVIPLTSLPQSAVKPKAAPATTVTTLPGTRPAVTVVSGAAVDLKPFPTVPTQPAMTTQSLLARVQSLDAGMDFSTTLDIPAKFAIGSSGTPVDYSTAAASLATAEKDKAKFSGGISVESLAQMGVSVRFRMKISPVLSWGAIRANVDEFSLVVNTSEKENYNVDAYFKGEFKKSFKVEKAEVELPDIVFEAGPIPVVITNTLGLTADLDVKGQGAFHIDGAVQSTQQVGFRYSSQGGMENLTTVPTATFLPSSFDKGGQNIFSGKSEVAVGPSITLTSKLYGFAGPQIAAGAQVGVTGEVAQAQDGWKFYSSLFLQGNFALRAEFPNFLNLEKDSIKPIADWQPRTTLAKWVSDYSGLTKVVSTSENSGTSYAVRDDGRVWTWGYQGPGTFVDYPDYSQNAVPMPAPLEGVSDVKSVVAGANAAYALKKDGTVWAWGRNDSGQLGDGTQAARWTPAPVPGLSGVVQLDAGFGNAYAVKSDGTVWYWGTALPGYLNGTGAQTRPTQLRGISDVKFIAPGAGEGYALKNDGTVWAWGWNRQGGVGDGTTITRVTPVRVAGLTNIKSIAAGSGFALAADASGAAWSWGYNGNAGLGAPATVENQLVPKKIAGLAGVTQVGSSAGLSAFALKSDGTVWKWGDLYGTRVYTPQQVQGIGDVSTLSIGNGTYFAKKKDGSLWSWGSNSWGSVGNGQFQADSSRTAAFPVVTVPTQVGIRK